MNQHVGPTQAATGPHPTVRAVNAMTAAIVGQDHDTLTKLFTDDFTLHIRGPVPAAGDHHGVGGRLEAFGSLFAVTEGDIDLEQQFCIGADGWAAEWERATFGCKGKKLESMNSFVYRFDDDRIAEMWTYFGMTPEQAEVFLA